MIFGKHEVVRILPKGPCGTLVSVDGEYATVSCVDNNGDTPLGQRRVHLTEIEPVDGTPHHPNGPSSLERRAHCPGSRWMEEGRMDIESTDAKEGTQLHEASFNKAARKLLTIDQQELLEVVDDAFARFEVSEWMPEKRVFIFDYDANPFSPPVLLYGTADALGRLDDDTMVVGEIKFGYDPVPPPHENLQTAAEVVAVSQQFNVKRVIVMIIQPRVSHEPKIHEFTEFDAMYENISAICRATDSETLILKDGPGCKYCRARTTCPVLVKANRDLVRIEPSLVHTGNAQDVYRKAGLVKKKMDALQSMVKELVINNGGLDGFKVINKSGARSIDDLQQAYNALSQWMTVEEFLSCCTASVSQIEKLFASKAKAAGMVKTLKEASQHFVDMVPIKYSNPRSEIRLK